MDFEEVVGFDRVDEGVGFCGVFAAKVEFDFGVG